jgi:DNA recombination protein RmuC
MEKIIINCQLSIVNSQLSIINCSQCTGINENRNKFKGELMQDILIFAAGLLFGGIFVYFVMLKLQKHSERLQKNSKDEMAMMVNQMRETFGSLSFDALQKSTEEFLKLANKSFSEQAKRNTEDLVGKKGLIDQNLSMIKAELDKVQHLMQKIEGERRQSFGSLNQQLQQSVEQTQKLREVTSELNQALSNSQVRGQWGERMAEDVLRMAGFIEGINYQKQKSGANSQSRPDFIFFLPHNLKVNMDVKFPLNNYLAYLKSENDAEKSGYKQAFLKDVRNRVKEVTIRGYINPADHTVDYVIVFIPNEQVYAFINEMDPTILDEALKSKVILSSPITLYAILSIIHQAVENFNLEQTASQILTLLADFSKQWEKYKEVMERMGKRIDDAQKEFQILMSTRTNALERPLQKIESIRSAKELVEKEV